MFISGRIEVSITNIYPCHVNKDGVFVEQNFQKSWKKRHVDSFKAYAKKNK